MVKVRYFKYLVVLCLFLNSCVYYPTMPEKQSPCDVVTRELKLELSTDLADIISEGMEDCSDEDCMTAMVALLAIPVGSYIVSGSIVLAGNTLHWLEKKGRCDEDESGFPLFAFLDHTYKHFGFKKNEVALGNGKINVGAIGSYRKISEVPHVSHIESPYYFSIGFKSQNENDNPKAIENIRLISENGERLYFFDGGRVESHWFEYSRQWICSWTYDELELDHETVTVAFDLIFMKGNDKKISPVSLVLQPEYKETTKSNIPDIRKVWDAMMGI